MRIGELARRAGVSTSLIRFYEAKGLLAAAARAENGYRTFGPRDLKMIAFIDRAQRLGFSLRDIGAFLATAAQHKPLPAILIARLEAKLLDIEAHLAEVTQRREDIIRLIQELKSQPAS